MSDSFRKKKFTNISNILPNVVEKLGLDRRLNEQALLGLWPSLIDKIYANRSVPLYIDNQNIIWIAVKDSSTAQELSFLKLTLIKKLKQIGRQLGIKVEGLRFDLKQFHSTKERQPNIESDAHYEINFSDIADTELKSIELTKEQLKETNQLKEEISRIMSPIGSRIIELVEKRMRLNNWHRSQNLPFCKLCSEPLFLKTVVLCHYCLQQKQSQSQIV